MTRLAAPLIIAAHVAALPTLPGWDGVVVFEGGVNRRDPVPTYCTVGYVQGDDGPAVHLEPTHPGQSQNREAGSIASNLIVAAADVAAARAAVFDLLTPWSGWLAADRTLGQVLLPTSLLTLVADVVVTTTRDGATASAIVTTSYSAVTYG